jgi:hypothetical protein
MNEYHKIQSVFLRDPETNFKTLLEGQWALPVFGYLADNAWVFTEKVDGTNIRVMIDPFSERQSVLFGGKTDNASIPAFLITALQDMFLPQADLLREIFPTGGCLYGEGYGPRIQKGGGLYRKDPSFVLFDVKVGHYWLQRKDVYDIAYRLGLDVVPEVGTGTLYDGVDFAARGFKSRWGDFLAEGIVARPLIEFLDRNGRRIITKIKTKDFVTVPTINRVDDYSLTVQDMHGNKTPLHSTL